MYVIVFGGQYGNRTINLYPYVEPSDLEQIQMIRRGADEKYPYDKNKLDDKIYGAWLGRICGCMLGKSVEGIRTNDLIPFLSLLQKWLGETHRYHT